MSVKSFFGKMAAKGVNVAEKFAVYTVTETVVTVGSAIRTAGVVRQTAVPMVKSVAAATELLYNQGRVDGLVMEQNLNETTKSIKSCNEYLKSLLNKGEEVQEVSFKEAYEANRK